MTIAAWPVARRSQLVHAFKPGERSKSEARYRTLRKHSWATSGVQITSRQGSRLAGQFTIFSSLNVEAARLARHGQEAAAVRAAVAATEMESRPEFGHLGKILADLPTPVAQAVIDGVIPDDPPAQLLKALRSVARATEELRERELSGTRPADFLAGRVKEVHQSYVIVVLMSGPETLIPRWMAAGAANRAQVGSLLALITDKLSEASAVIDVIPALDVNDDGPPAPFTPFGRGDKRALAITADDEQRLAGDPEPLQILVPVAIEP
jgi:hypothetical protein